MFRAVDGDVLSVSGSEAGAPERAWVTKGGGICAAFGTPSSVAMRRGSGVDKQQPLSAALPRVMSWRRAHQEHVLPIGYATGLADADPVVLGEPGSPVLIGIELGVTALMEESRLGGRPGRAEG